MNFRLLLLRRLLIVVSARSTVRISTVKSEDLRMTAASSTHRLEDVVATASALADTYINEKLDRSSTVGEESAPSFTRKFVRLARELEKRHVMQYDEMCKSLVVNGRTVYPIFSQIASELFKNGVNWGRILGLYAFAGSLCEACFKKSMPEMVEEVKKWLVVYLKSNLAAWIIDHGGWVSGFLLQRVCLPRLIESFILFQAGFDAHFKDTAQEEKQLSQAWKVVGLAALGAIAFCAVLRR